MDTKATCDILNTYAYSDMAAELYADAEAKKDTARVSQTTKGLVFDKRELDGILSETLHVQSKEAAEIIGKSVGTYYTVHTGKLWLHSQKTYRACVRALREALLSAIGELTPDFCMPQANEKNTTVKANNKRAWGDAHTGIDFPLLDPSSPLEEDMIDPIGADAVTRLSVSPEWNQGSDIYHRRNTTGSVENDFLEDAGVTCVTEIPPEPLAQTPLMSEPHGGSREERKSESAPQKRMSVLVVGLGNPELTPDALGTLCVRCLNVTRHLDGPLFSVTNEELPFHALSAFCPMVLGQTGIETLSLVQGAVEAVNPDLVILLDALAASQTESLFSTVQIATTGIHPGGGIGNKREPITKETLGVPTLTVGVPTVISASTMLCRVIEDSTLLAHTTEEQTSRLSKTLESLSSCFVSPKDADIAQREYARLIAYVISEAILGSSLTEEWFRRI